MATLNFPDNPSTGDEYYDTNAGFNYEWNGTVWITKDLATVNNTREIDDISSGFDGSDTTFTLQINGVNIVPSKVQQLIISVGGVMQNPGDDYTVSGSTLTFTNAPLSGLSFVGTILGAAVSLNTISAGTVSPSSLTTTSNYTVGSIKVSGASTIGNFVLTGLTTIADPDVTNLNSSGVGTVSNVIITGDNSGLGATVGTSVGVITYFGDAFNMTGVGLSIFPLSYDPGISSTSQPADTNITTTWNYPLQAGSGTITIRTGSGSGTIVDQFVVGSSSSITISGRTLTLNPAADLAADTEHFVVYPAGSIKSTSGQKENNELITSFTTELPKKYLFMTGYNSDGQQGTNTSGWSSMKSSPVQVPGNNWVKAFSGPESGSVVIMTKNDGTLWSWGDNADGELGVNDVADRSSPTQVGTDTTWGTGTWNTGMNTGQCALAVKTNGTLWAWGENAAGQLGQNSLVKISSPTQIGTETTWALATTTTDQKISQTKGQSVKAIKTDGTMWAWGENEYGVLGLNDIADRSSPVQVGTNTNWKAAGWCMGLKTDGTLWSWGDGRHGGKLGQNAPDNSSLSSPTQVPGTNWSDISGGGTQHMMVLKDDNTLWVWGSNFRGLLGLNEGNVQRSSPVQIPGTTWSDVQAGGSFSKSIKTDGTYWMWGMNYVGDSGNPSFAHEYKLSSPTQIGTKSDYLLKGALITPYVAGGWLRTSDDS
jgi:alpha-tubulin suppressor-like RCC1 family protein